MKIGFITTINTNIGDDFIRTGIENILASIKDANELQYTYVNKHNPDTSNVGYSPLHLIKRLPTFPYSKKRTSINYTLSSFIFLWCVKFFQKEKRDIF